MKLKIWMPILLIFILFQACAQNTNAPIEDDVLIHELVHEAIPPTIQPSGKTLATRIKPPTGYERISASNTSYPTYLRNLPLKPRGSKVKYHNGNTKENNNIYEAVIDLRIGQKNLHQCADAVMRLRAEYLWKQKKYDQIHFNFTNGFRVDYSEWMKGRRIKLKGNRSFWVDAKKPSNTYQDFWDYMELVFMYAGTLSLEKELKAVPSQEMQIGDVFIQGGSPGHAILVIDMAINPKTNEKVFMLAQSFMPAQEIQILTNQGNKSLSPWYSTNFGNRLESPEWTFSKNELKRFGE